MANNYVDNDELNTLLTEWKIKCDINLQKGEDRPRISERLGEIILLMAQNIIRRPEYRKHQLHHESMIGAACENVVKYLHCFNPEAETRSGKPNPFSYLTRTIMTAFLRHIENEETALYLKLKSYELEGDRDWFDDSHSNEELINEGLRDNGISSDYSDFISYYEDKREKKRRKKEEKRLERNPPEPEPEPFMNQFFS